MKSILLFFCLLLFICTNLFSQKVTVDYPLKTGARDISGNHNNGRLLRGASIDNHLIIPYNGKSILNVPIEVINGMKHYSIHFDVYFDSLHTYGDLARNTILYGSFLCGDGRVNIYYNEVEKPVKSWVVMLEGKKYVFHDREVKAQQWNHIDIIKRSDSVKLYKNSILLGSYADESDSIKTAILQIGQTQVCVGTNLPMCLDGFLKNFKIVSYDKASTDSTNKSFQKINAVATSSSVLNIYPNPSNGIVTITPDKFFVNQTRPVIITIYNSLGILYKTISSAALKSPLTLNLGNIPSGIYFIQIANNVESETGKIIIR